MAVQRRYGGWYTGVTDLTDNGKRNIWKYY